MSEPLDVFAACVDCGATISNWPAKLLPIQSAEVVLTERLELALRVDADEEVCAVCGSAFAEIRVEREKAC